MDLIYRVDESDLTRDKNVSYSPQIGWKVKVNCIDFIVSGISINMDEEDVCLYVDLARQDEFINPANGIAKCVAPFKQSSNLTREKDYPILKNTETHFFIIDNNGVKRSYKHGNSQFIIY